jgi:hypothetical protein
LIKKKKWMERILKNGLHLISEKHINN